MNVKKSTKDQKVVKPSKLPEGVQHKWLSELKYHTLIADKEGALLGNITDAYINLTNKKLFGIEVKKNFWLDKFYIQANDIKSIGEDIVSVENKSMVKTLTHSKQDKHKTLKDLKSCRITTFKGKHLGELKDINISTHTFEIDQLLFESGDKLGVKASEITIGEDEILVPTEYESLLTKKPKDSKPHYAKDFIDSFSKTFHIKKNKKEKSKQATHH